MSQLHPPTTPTRRRHRQPVLAVLAAVALAVALLVGVPEARAQSSLPEFGGAVELLDPLDQGWSASVQQTTIVRVADVLEDPLGAYYLYYGTPNEGGIGLAYADDPRGPFTAHPANPIIAQGSGPHAVVTDGEVWLYHHRGEIVRATSADGITFSAAEEVLHRDDMGGIALQLPRVFGHTLPSIGNTWTMLVMGIDGGTRKIFAATSDDGVDFSPLDGPVVSPGAGEGGQIASPHLLEVDGEVLVAYHAASGSIHATRVGADLDEEVHLGVLHSPLSGEPDRGKVAAPSFLEVGGDLLMYYDAGPTGAATIAVVTAGEDGSEPPVEEPDPIDFPEFTHAGRVIDASTSPTNEYIFPSIIRASDHFDDPLGEYYLYYGPHDAPGGIYLAYSDSLDGPFTPYEANPVIGRVWEPHYSVSHVASAHPIWMEDRDELFMYFHGENSVTRIASSTDGITFDYVDRAVDTSMYVGINEASYARVFEHTIPAIGNRYTMLFMGNQGGTRKIFLATSDDGVDWDPVTRPVISPGPGESGQISSPWLYLDDGRTFVLYHSGSGTIHATEVGTDFDIEHHLGVVYASSTGLRAAAPSFLTEGDTTYMFYENGPRLSATISYATAVTGDPDPDPDPGPRPGPVAPDPGADPDPDPEPDPVDPPLVPAELGEVDDPIDLAVAVSRMRFTSAEGADGEPSHAARRHQARPTPRPAARVVLARVDVFADSLAAGVLTADAPLLLTGDVIAPAVLAEIDRVLGGQGEVLLVGGEAALPPAIAETVIDMGYDLRRLAGDSRVETALAVADEALTDRPGRVMIARSDAADAHPTAAWADAVTAGAYSAESGVPVVLTPTEDLHPAVAAWLDGARPTEVVVIGGEAAVSPRVVDAVTVASVRLDGANRNATAVMVADRLWTADGRSPASAFLLMPGTHEHGWAVGLAAAGLAADTDRPLLLVADDTLPPETVDRLGCGGPTAAGAEIVGGPSLVGEGVRQALRAC